MKDGTIHPEFAPEGFVWQGNIQTDQPDTYTDNRNRAYLEMLKEEMGEDSVVLGEPYDSRTGQVHPSQDLRGIYVKEKFLRSSRALKEFKR